jgi:hypothetical protein
LSGHLSGGATSSAPHLDGSAGFSVHDDEYDRYQDISESSIKELLAEFEVGKIPAMDLARIL